jgi:hypothetical protein
MSRDRVAYVSREHAGARSGTRTRTPLRAKAFEASASTDSAIRAAGPAYRRTGVTK